MTEDRRIDDALDACPLPPGSEPPEKRGRLLNFYDEFFGNWKIVLSVLAASSLVLAYSLLIVPPPPISLPSEPDAWIRPMPEQIYRWVEDSVWEPRYENRVEHEGDLILEGDEIFVIENCTFIEIGKVVIRDSARLLLRNAELYIESALRKSEDAYPISLDDTAVFEADDAVISYYNPRLVIKVNGSARIMMDYTEMTSSYIVISDDSEIILKNSPMDTIILGQCSRCVITNSKVNRLMGGYDCLSLVTNSTLERVVLTFGDSKATVKGRILGHHLFWNPYANYSVDGEVFNLTLYDTNVTGGLSLIANQDSEVSVVNQQHLYGVTASGSLFTLANSSCWNFGSTEDSISNVSDSVISWLFLLDNSTVTISRSKIGEVLIHEFNGTVDFDDVLIDGRMGVSESQCYFDGKTAFGANCSVDREWSRGSSVVRGYEVEALTETHMLDGVKLQLYDKENALVWSGSTDKMGRAYFNISFYETFPIEPFHWETNLWDSWRLEAHKGETSHNVSVGFLSDSPITFTFLQVPSVPLWLQREFVAVLSASTIVVVLAMYLRKKSLSQM